MQRAQRARCPPTVTNGRSNCATCTRTRALALRQSAHKPRLSMGRHLSSKDLNYALRIYGRNRVSCAREYSKLIACVLSPASSSTACAMLSKRLNKCMSVAVRRCCVHACVRIVAG